MPNADKQTKLLTEHFLSKADANTVISFKVKKDLSKYLNFIYILTLGIFI